MSTKSLHRATPYPRPKTSLSGPLRRPQLRQLAAPWTLLLPVMLVITLSTFGAHAQGRPGERAAATSCEVCIPADYAEACDRAAQDADAYWGEARALQRAQREAEERAQRAALERELARREAEAAQARGWWMLAGGAGGATVLLVLVYALAQ